MATRLPSSQKSYFKGVCGVLPPRSVRTGLRDLEIFTAEDACPKKNESLCSWVDVAARTRRGKIPITLVLGESASDYRKKRQDIVGKPPDARLLNMAYTCDGAAGSRALIGLLQNSQLGIEDVDFDAVIDEWCMARTPSFERIKNSHLLVIGTPEVNAIAVFFHGLVKDFHFGRDVWPADLSSTGDKLFVSNLEYLRCPRGHEVSDLGGVFLIRNPWNPEYRVLWIAGLTGRATWYGSSIVVSGWSKHLDMAGVSIGALLGRDVVGGDKEIGPRDWLVWCEGKPMWESSLKWRPPAQTPATQKGVDEPTTKKHVFLSYCHENKGKATKLHEDLTARGINVWWDKRILAAQYLDYRIVRAINESCAVVVCFSRELLARDKSFVFKEIRQAARIQSEYPPDRAFLFPVRLSKCNIPSMGIEGNETIDRLKWVNLFPKSQWNNGVSELVDGLRAAGCAD